MTPGPRRYLVSGRYVTWREWAGLLAEALRDAVAWLRAAGHLSQAIQPGGART